MGFMKSEADANLYYLVVRGEVIILVLYVDDFFLTSSLGLIEECKRDLAAEFEMKDLGLTHQFLGMEVWQIDGEIFLGQGKYCIEISRKFEMEDFRGMSTSMIMNWKKVATSSEKDVDLTLYKKLIGSLMYLVDTRLDISFAVNSLSQFMVEPKRVHWTTTKHVLCYFPSTISESSECDKEGEMEFDIVIKEEMAKGNEEDDPSRIVELLADQGCSPECPIKTRAEKRRRMKKP
ncbi:uncharacterized mitochondrial protein AtMg00810-like [Cryptomeria japonica]|uniref:uncharacterized mitochondrial protein AtMg00810-like n=1 Tax=Cryptomeria japonica TaxID=3369 RepID=UPI0027D9D74F|nr:uncharacterized mitochondrial protein AtMg00810-like [Cryptomeria japonica]